MSDDFAKHLGTEIHFEQLTELQYSDQVGRDESLRLYRYEPTGFHYGGQFFRARPKFKDEEISTTQARVLAENHLNTGFEVRITNGGDFLVYHAKDGAVIYPTTPEAVAEFWRKAEGLEPGTETRP